MIENQANPIDTLIDFAWSAGADRFWVNNAKDELKRLREKQKEWVEEVYRANQFAVEQTNEYLKLASELQKLKDSLDNPVAYATTNELGDLYDLNVQNNPYKNQTTVVPLYRINHE